MTYIDQGNVKKAGVLLATVALLTVSGAAIGWNFPEDGEEFGSDVFLSFDTSSVQGSIQNITLEVEGPNQDDYGFFKEATQDSGDNYTVTFDKGNDGEGTHGDYEFRARAYNGSGPNEETSSRTFTLDTQSPKVDSFDPSEDGFTNEGDDLDVSYSSSDSHTSVDYENISISSEDESSESDELSSLSLDEGDYTVDYWVNDTVGNVNQGDWDFTVDTEYDGDKDPKFSPSNDNIFLLEDEDDDQAFDITLDEADSESDTKVECYDGDDYNFDSTDYKDVESDGTAFTCEMEADDYSGGSVDVYIKTCDEAGNCEEIDEGITYHLDAEKPEISSLSTVSGASAFNSNFEVSFLATDDSSGTERVEYYYDSDTEEGDGTAINYSSEQDSYEVDVSGLDSGENTLYVRAKDEAGRWSGENTLEFEYYPNKDPQLTLNAPDQLKVMSGNSKEFKVTLENTGELFIPSTNLSYESNVSSDWVEMEGLAKGDLVTHKFSFETDEFDIGRYDIALRTDNPQNSKTIDLRVEANENQKERIKSSFSDLENRFSDLKTNVTDLRSDVSGEREETLLYNFSALNKTMNNAEKALEEGRYYEVQSAIENFDSEFKKAAQSYSNVKKEYKASKKQKLLFAALGVFLIIVLGGIGYIVHQNKYEFDLSGHEIDISSLKVLDDLEIKLKSILEGKDEAEEYEWEGFESN